MLDWQSDNCGFPVLTVAGTITKLQLSQIAFFTLTSLERQPNVPHISLYVIAILFIIVMNHKPLYNRNIFREFLDSEAGT